MKLILAVPALCLLASAIGIHSKNSLSNSKTDADIAVSESSAIWVEHAECYRNESFNLHFSESHASTLGVVDPDGKFFYLVFPKACTLGELKPLVCSEEFEGIRQLSISTASLTADPYTYGVLENQPVFTKTGIYRFILGDNLHVDDEFALSIAEITYIHRDRTTVERT